MADELKDTMHENRGNAKAQPSGPKGDNSAKDTKVKSHVAEKAKDSLNPSAPGDTGTTPGSIIPVE